ncbi:hypothetical protein IAG44_06960 [Streptomyces roseirectus]|uniref:Uncharacterized protein n=1 Tax=Streptomyces roseirectus TaxID=2768066 RepID=A0A7H0I8U0_9ACTN|nr:hypothetical protein [Streptomyces roseirectus]QNP69206.1 hypothetical protein IAG44_06960 [Streptomyces roseirectus]
MKIPARWGGYLAVPAVKLGLRGGGGDTPPGYARSGAGLFGEAQGRSGVAELQLHDTSFVS